MGTVGAGFDNNGDLIPDRNAWMQPVGDPGQYSPLNFRLVKCYGIVVVKLNDGTERLIPFEDRLYFENLPPNNTGAIGLVYYEFIPVTAGSVASTSPYQEVASGYDNEKFNADYGAGGTFLTAAPPALTLDKTAPLSVSPSSSVPFAITATNTGTSTIGDPNYGIPFAIEDTIPAGVTYKAGSATVTSLPAGNTVAITYGTGSPLVWSSTEPGDATTVKAVRWTLTSAGLKAGENFAVGFQVNVPADYASRTLENTAIARYNGIGVLASDTTVSLLSGPNSIGDLVWFDANRDGLSTGESGIPAVGVTLYYDANGNGIIDDTEPVFATTETDASGLYSFTSLPDGNYIVVLDSLDPQLPQGYVLPASVNPLKTVALDVTNDSGNTGVAYLDADWPFIEALVLNKRTDPTTYEQGDLVTYFIDVENHTEPVGPLSFPVQTAYATSVYGGRPAQNGTNAQGAPDSTFARLDFSQASDGLTADPSSGIWPNPKPPTWNWSFADKAWNIVKVELVIKGYMQSLLASKLPLTTATFDDTVQVHINNSDTGNPTADALITAAQLVAMQGGSKELVVDITNLNEGLTFSWAQLEAAKIRLKVAKVVTINNDNAVLWTDSIGIRVTTDAPPPPTGTFGDNSLDPVPLQDVFNTSQFDYVSAIPSPTSVVNGTVSWADVGPVNPGTRRTVSLTLRAKSPSGTLASDVYTNTARTTGASYADGRPANSAEDTQDITVLQRALIGDLVYWDMNKNGSYDAGEGIPNVLVYLDNGAQAYTNAEGVYLFDGLSAGTYIVTVDPTTLPFTTSTNFQDPDGGGDSTSSVTLAVDSGRVQSNLNQDFGYTSDQNAISGSIFTDNNGDGDQDPGENYISGLTVQLCNGPVLLATTTTDVNGYYLFPGLTSLNYTVKVTPPGGTVQTLEYGNDGAMDNTVIVNASGTSTLYPNRNFAYQPSGTFTLGDTVYLDVDADGTQDAGEPGLPGITVSLYEDANGDGIIDPTTDALIASMDTTATGSYLFENLPAGKYIVVVDAADLPANNEQTEDYDGVADNFAKVELTTASIDTVDFGYVTTGTGSIGDKVFVDTTADGIHDAFELGIPDITVKLYYDSNGDGQLDANDVLVAETSTDENGNYLFSNLPPAKYIVDVDAADSDMPANYLGTNSDPHSLTLADAQNYLLADFGFAPAGSIGDTVFYDNNGNGTQDWNEPGIGGVTVTLYLDSDGDGAFDIGEPEVATMLTNTSDATKPVGFYMFTGLPEGQYIVKVRRDDNLSPALTDLIQTADPDRDGVPYPSSDPALASLPAPDDTDSGITLSPGLTYTGADFGYQPSVVIGDTAWFDLDADGIEDAGEPGIANVTLTISDGMVSYPVTTDLDGKWSLANIGDGNWTITVDDSNFAPGGPLYYLAALSPTFDPAGGTATPSRTASFTVTGGKVQALAGNDDTGAVGLNDDLDFGFSLNGDYAIRGTIVTNDSGVAGTADAPDTELELAGFTVYLFDDNNKLLGTTVTDADGNYAFEGLVPGTYSVLINKDIPVLSGASLTTTAANNPVVSALTSSLFAVNQTLAITDQDVEDVDFAFTAALSDFGDLPASYNLTTLFDDGARHTPPAGGFTRYLGNNGAPDTEITGVESTYALSDGADEDGIQFSPNAWTAGASVSDPGSGSLSVTVTGGGWLVIWIDWNNDGDFLDSGEMIVSQAVSEGDDQVIGFSIPANTLTDGAQSWYSRARLFSSQPPVALLSYSGETVDGEVEDYYIARNSGAISGTVLNDTNGDGTGDSPMADVTLTLYTDPNGDGDPSDGVPFGAPVTTDADGKYSFTGLPPGNYVVVQSPPDGYALVADGDTTDPDDDAAGNPDTKDNWIPVSLVAGEEDTGNDFVNVQLASLGDYVWWDVNGDDVQDASEFPISGATVYVDLDKDGSFDADEPSAVTGTDGSYLIEGLVPGTYDVRITGLPTGATASYDLDGGDDNKASVTLTPGQERTDVDFGYTGNSSIGDYVWNDADGDGNQDTNELPIEGVTLFLDLDKDGSQDANEPSTTTDADGAYLFPGLPPGEYIVVVVKEGIIADATQTGDPDATVDNKTTVTLEAGDDHETADFGYQGLLSIGDFVWNDLDGDGEQDSGEPGIQDIIVFIDTDGDGERGTHEPFARTDADGAYSIAGLLPGTYAVKLDPDTIPASATVTGDPDTDIDGATTVILVDESVDTVDFGLNTPSTSASIAGILWVDLNGDGKIDEGEPLLKDVDVFLDLNGDGVFDEGTDQRITTNADGEYSFGDLPPGTYTICVDQETLPGGASATYDKDSGTTDPDQKIEVEVKGGDIVSSLDFGYRGTGTIGDYVWVDTDGDGDQDDTERPLSGVRVYLDLDDDENWDAESEPSAVTDSDGAYSITNLFHGTYTVRVDTKTKPSGSTITGDPDATKDGVHEVTLNEANPSADDVDFGFQGNSSIGDTVWYDLDGDGSLDPGENVLDGVTLFLDFDEDGVLDDNEPSVITDEDGLYSFSGLLAGEYIVRVDTSSLPAGLEQTYDKDGIVTADATTVDLPEATALNDVDFGYRGTATVAGCLYIDANGNGTRDEGEVGLADVDVLVTDSNGFVHRVTTGSDGKWTADVPPGKTLPAVDLTDPDIPEGYQRTEGDDVTELEAEAGKTVNDENDGFFFPSSISGKVQVDTDGDGDADEPRSGVTITLYTDAGDGEPGTVVATKTTGADGSYRFNEVPPGNYVVVQTLPAGYLLVKDGDSTDGDDDTVATNDPTDSRIPVTVAASESDTGNDFLIRTECPTSWAEWQALNPLDGNNGSTANPDGDRWSNLQEFVYCLDPASGVAECPIELVFNQDGTIDACVRTVKDARGVIYRLEYIADLNASLPNGGNWTDSGLTPVLTDNGDGSMTACFENLESLLSGGQGFVRSVVEVDTDDDVNTAPVVIRSNVEGWMDQTLGVNCETICLPFDACPVFTGVAGITRVPPADPSGAVPSVDVSAAVGSNTLASLWEAGRSYYIDILSGPYEGHRLEIDTEDSTAATLYIKDSPRNTLSVYTDITGASIAVRAYKTLAEQFPPADYSVASDTNEADYVLIFENGNWVTYYLLDVSGTPTWVNAKTGTTDRGGEVLDPGAGMFVHRQVSPLFQTQSGSVREAKFARPLALGYTFIPNPWPVAASIADRALVNTSTASATAFNGATTMGLADQVMLWRADTTAGQFSYDARFYLKAGARNYYTQAGSSSLININDDLLFKPLRSQKLHMKSDHLDYVMPVPWTP